MRLVRSLSNVCGEDKIEYLWEAIDSLGFMGYFYNASVHTIRDIDAGCRVVPCRAERP